MDFRAEILSETALVIGDPSRSASKRENNVLILAGGAGSGKSFVYTKIIDFEGKVFNVDSIKSKLIYTGKYKTNDENLKKHLQLYKTKLQNSRNFEHKSVEVLKELKSPKSKYYYLCKDLPDSLNPNELDLSNEAHVTFLHKYVEHYQLGKKGIENFFNSIDVNSQHKPNVIFDVTLKNIDKLKEISELVIKAGYKKENIHIVWILTDLELASENNSNRERSINTIILHDTHTGVSGTMSDIMKHTVDVRDYADGDIWIMFNRISRTGKDDLNKDIEKDDNYIKVTKGINGKSLFEVKRYTAVKIKDQKGDVYSKSQIKEQLKDVFEKILNYTPIGSFTL